MSNGEEIEQTIGFRGSPQRARRRALWVSAAAALALALAAVTTGYVASSSTSDSPERKLPAPATVRVTAGSMVSETRVPGVLRYSDIQPVIANTVGVVTELPPAGAAVGKGGVLFRVNTLPVVLLTGATPAWRDFVMDMDEGPDIRQLEENLVAMDFLDDSPDDRFTGNTATAITRWQEALGVKQTGRVERSSIVFSPHDLRVDTVESRVGAEVAPGTVLYQATSARMIVELEMRSADRGLAVPGATVAVSLPSGEEVDGVVETVGSPVNKTTDQGRSAVVIPVRLSVEDQAAIADLALAGVTVGFASTLKEDVLTVPVDALVPIGESRFAVELPAPSPEGGRDLVTVTVGAFASGRVEISGEGIEEGVEVVVPG